MDKPANTQFSVLIQQSDFDIASLQRELLQGSHSEGAVATFTGYVRVDDSVNSGSEGVYYLEIEHYPTMTEKSIESIVAVAAERWPIEVASVVHRIGRLYPGEQIVWVGVSSIHRQAAFRACEYIMDYLKTEAPLWKKEHNGHSESWVEAKNSDVARLDRWDSMDSYSLENK